MQCLPAWHCSSRAHSIMPRPPLADRARSCQLDTDCCSYGDDSKNIFCSNGVCT